MAVFVVFEGQDGSGKSTQARALQRRLRRRQYSTLLTREPGGTPLGEVLRRWLKGRRNLSPLSELFLFVSARAQLVQQVIKPALESGTNVIGDRFSPSTTAYQGYGRGLDLGLIDQLNRAATDGTTADLTVLLDLPPEVALARKADPGVDTFDAAPLLFHQKVRDGYLAQVRQDSERWLVLDGTLPQRQLSQQVWTKVQPLL